MSKGYTVSTMYYEIYYYIICITVTIYFLSFELSELVFFYRFCVCMHALYLENDCTAEMLGCLFNKLHGIAWTIWLSSRSFGYLKRSHTRLLHSLNVRKVQCTRSIT